MICDSCEGLVVLSSLHNRGGRTPSASCSGLTSFTSQVSVGRFPDNYLYIEDREVSGKHALLNWDRQRRTWQVRDMGSMNGTRLNGTFISSAARRPGKHWQLSSDDILLLGSRTAIKVWNDSPGICGQSQHILSNSTEANSNLWEDNSRF